MINIGIDVVEDREKGQEKDPLIERAEIEREIQETEETVQNHEIVTTQEKE